MSDEDLTLSEAQEADVLAIGFGVSGAVAGEKFVMLPLSGRQYIHRIYRLDQAKLRLVRMEGWSGTVLWRHMPDCKCRCCSG